jgi:hypothetical protein
VHLVHHPNAFVDRVGVDFVQPVDEALKRLSQLALARGAVGASIAIVASIEAVAISGHPVTVICVHVDPGGAPAGHETPCTFVTMPRLVASGAGTAAATGS